MTNQKRTLAWQTPKRDTSRVDVRGVADPFVLATTSVARASAIGLEGLEKLENLELLENLEPLENLELLEKLEQQATFSRR